MFIENMVMMVIMSASSVYRGGFHSSCVSMIALALSSLNQNVSKFHAKHYSISFQWIFIISMELSTLYFKGSQVKFFIK